MTLKEVDIDLAQFEAEYCAVAHQRSVAAAKVSECDVELADISFRRAKMMLEFKKVALSETEQPVKE